MGSKVLSRWCLDGWWRGDSHGSNAGPWIVSGDSVALLSLVRAPAPASGWNGTCGRMGSLRNHLIMDELVYSGFRESCKKKQFSRMCKISQSFSTGVWV